MNHLQDYNPQCARCSKKIGFRGQSTAQIYGTDFLCEYHYNKKILEDIAKTKPAKRAIVIDEEDEEVDNQ